MDSDQQARMDYGSLGAEVRKAISAYATNNLKACCRWVMMLNNQKEALTLAVILCWVPVKSSLTIYEYLKKVQETREIKDLFTDICGEDIQNIPTKFDAHREQIATFFSGLTARQLQRVIDQYSKILVDIAKFGESGDTIQKVRSLGDRKSKTGMLIILHTDSQNQQKAMVVFCTQSQNIHSQVHAQTVDSNNPSPPNIFTVNKSQSLQKASNVSNQSFVLDPTRSTSPHHEVHENDRVPLGKNTMEEINQDSIDRIKQTRSVDFDHQEGQHQDKSQLVNSRLSQHSHNSPGSFDKNAHKDHPKSNQSILSQDSFNGSIKQNRPVKNQTNSLVDRNQNASSGFPQQHQGQRLDNQPESFVSLKGQDPLDGYCEQCEEYQVLDPNNRLCWSCFQKKSKSQNDMGWLWTLVFAVLTAILVLLNYYHARQSRVTTGFEHIRILSTLSSQLYQSLFSQEPHTITVSNNDF